MQPAAPTSHRCRLAPSEMTVFLAVFERHHYPFHTLLMNILQTKLSLLHGAGVTFNLKDCKFFTRKIESPGYVI